MMGFALEALVYHIRPQSGPSYTLQSRMGLMAKGEGRLSQVLVSGASRAKSKTSDHPLGIDSHEQMEALIPSQLIAPADVGLSCQPTRTPALGIPGGHSRAIQGFIGTVASCQQSHQVTEESDDGKEVPSEQPV